MNPFSNLVRDLRETLGIGSDTPIKEAIVSLQTRESAALARVAELEAERSKWLGVDIIDALEKFRKRVIELETRLDMWPRSNEQIVTQGALDSLLGQRDRAWARVGLPPQVQCPVCSYMEPARGGVWECPKCNSRVAELEHSLADAMDQIEAIQGSNAVHMARVKELEAAQTPRPMSEAPRDGTDVYLVFPALYEDCYQVGVGAIVTRLGLWGAGEGYWLGGNSRDVKPIGWWPVPSTTDAQVQRLQCGRKEKS